MIAERRLLLKPIKSNFPWEAYLLPVSGFGVPEEELFPVKMFLERLTSALLRDPKLSIEVFIQLMQLHWGGGPEKLAANGREWLPSLGLGVWPDREPPRFWSMEDFKNLTPGEKPRTLMDQVFRVTAPMGARLGACSILLGLGTLVQIFTRDTSEVFLERTKSVLLPPIKDPSYTCFPFYVPLLEAKSIASCSSADLDQWICGASLYVRESKQDNGILIVSKDPLKDVLHALGSRLRPGSEDEWEIRY